jgi:hypothetical protein
VESPVQPRTAKRKTTEDVPRANGLSSDTANTHWMKVRLVGKMRMPGRKELVQRSAAQHLDSTRVEPSSSCLPLK